MAAPFPPAPAPTPDEKIISLKVLVDSKANKVLFAEAGSDFVDVLLSFMTLPLGTIVKTLNTHLGPQNGAIGSLNTLYDSLTKLPDERFWTPEAKLILLNPKSCQENESWNLKFNVNVPTKYYICANSKCTKENHGSVVVSPFINVSRCFCGSPLNTEIKYSTTKLQTNKKRKTAESDEGVFTYGRRATFIITNDLQVLPHSVGSTIELVNSFGLKDLTTIQETTFYVEMKEIINLLKLSLTSKTPLSEWILHNTSHESKILYSAVSHTIKDNTTKMVLKVMVHKSTRKVLFAQSEEDFIDFLFSLLIMPLGKVASVSNANTSLVGIDNLYKSISCLNSEKYLKSEDVKTMLINPKLPLEYLCTNQILIPDNSRYYSSPPLFYYTTNNGSGYLAAGSSNYTYNCYVTMADLKAGNKGFVGGPASFIVTDDLQVSPFTSMSSLSLLNKLQIPFCDVEELELNVGIKESLDILRASLCSSSALTDVLGLKLMKPVKQEK